VDPARHPFWDSMNSTGQECQAVFARYLLNDIEAAEDEDLFRRHGDVIGGNKFRSQVATVVGQINSQEAWTSTTGARSLTSNRTSGNHAGIIYM
jgi:hypothetical protein